MREENLKKSKEDADKIKRAVSFLKKHGFDSVVIVTSQHYEKEGLTLRQSNGSGNHHARRDSVRDWLAANVADSEYFDDTEEGGI